MTQHLYECDDCHCYGVAHYVLDREDAESRRALTEVFKLRRLCTRCWKDYRAAGGRG
jgi:hypothetical protein